MALENRHYGNALMQLRFFVIVLSLVIAAVSGESYSQVLRKTGLLIRMRDGTYSQAAFSEQELNAPGMVCIRFNNYWCIKSPLGEETYWRGQISQDDRRHAQFSDPVFGARAFARLMHTYRFRYNLQSSSDILSRYAPTTDTVGSIEGNPLNPTNTYATFIARSVGKEPDDPLNLFHADGTFNAEIAVPVFQAFVRFELSAKYSIEEDFIIGAIRLLEGKDR